MQIYRTKSAFIVESAPANKIPKNIYNQMCSTRIGTMASGAHPKVGFQGLEPSPFRSKSNVEVIRFTAVQINYSTWSNSIEKAACHFLEAAKSAASLCLLYQAAPYLKISRCASEKHSG